MKNNSRAVRKVRKEQAAERQARYDASTTEQKLANITERRGNSAREAARLTRETV